MMGVGMRSMVAWALLGLGAGALVRAVTLTVGGPGLSAVTVSKPTMPARPPYHAESLGVVVVAHDPFRQGRRPAAAAYDPVGGNAPPPEAPPKPSLVLVGIVAAENPTAVIEGFPGIDGPRVVRVGDVVAGLRVRRIDKTTVRIAGVDTVWVLSVREPWK